jgi:high frequency lysogenization protein
MSSTDKTLALAGIFQAASLVSSLAKKGKSDEGSFETSILSLFNMNPSSTAEVYGNINNLQLGLKELLKAFTNDKSKDNNVIRYVLSILHLESKLRLNQSMLAVIKKGLDRAKIQSVHFFPTHDNVMANLAGLYTDTISTYQFKIHVTGHSIYLSQSSILNKIRAMLLAGIRSAVLWNQVGGSRWNIIFKGKILATTKQLLANT